MVDTFTSLRLVYNSNLSEDDLVVHIVAVREGEVLGDVPEAVKDELSRTRDRTSIIPYEYDGRLEYFIPLPLENYESREESPLGSSITLEDAVGRMHEAVKVMESAVADYLNQPDSEPHTPYSSSPLKFGWGKNS